MDEVYDIRVVRFSAKRYITTANSSVDHFGGTRRRYFHAVSPYLFIIRVLIYLPVTPRCILRAFSATSRLSILKRPNYTRVP